MNKVLSKMLSVGFLVFILLCNISQVGMVIQAGNGWWNASIETGKACEYLVKNLGFTKYAAAGLLGNFRQESNINPYVRERIGNHNTYSLGKEKADKLDPDNDGFGPGWGLAQWGDGSGLGGLGSGRWIELLKYVNTKYGTHYSAAYKDSYRPGVMWNEQSVRANVPNMYQQLDFVKHEMTRGSKYIVSQKELNEMSSVEETSDAILYRYEKAGTKTSEKRKQYAREIYQQYCSRIDGSNYIETFKNGGYIDNISVTADKFIVKGWHASVKANDNRRYMFIMDATTNQEIQRFQITNDQRPDVARTLPDVKSAIKSGFNVSVPISEQMRGKTVYVITRYLVNTNPNESLNDMWFTGNKITIPTKSVATVNYQSHVQYIGWQEYVKNGEVSGTYGQSLRVEGLRINLSNLPVEGGVRYATHIQNIGWQAPVTNNQLSGTTGRSLRLEAVNIKLTGAIEKDYDIYYRVHIENYGWLGWTKNGENAGSEGKSLRMEGIEVKLIKKGDKTIKTGNAFVRKDGVIAP